MSKKARDGQGRWRSKTIAFRISPEENALLEDFVRLSGLTKQEYILQRVMNREVVVVPNPRVHKALKEKLESLSELIGNMDVGQGLDGDTIELVKYIYSIAVGLKLRNNFKSARTVYYVQTLKLLLIIFGYID